jgi:aldose sugar dehydrogenase
VTARRMLGVGSLLLASANLVGCGDDSESSPGSGGGSAGGGAGGGSGASGSGGGGLAGTGGVAGTAGGCASGTACGAECIDTAIDPLHCGACNQPCAAGQACQASACVDVPPAESGDLVVEVIAKQLEVVWEIRFLPSGELLITERPGRVSRVSVSTGQVTTLGTLPVLHSGEGGLMGLALSPSFATDSQIYVCYTYSDGGTKNRVSRLSVSDSALSDETHLLSDIPGASNHNGCRLEFGPDGKLYATTGDAQDTSSAQDPGSLAGKLLRLNPDGSVPADNPTAGSYVYSLGHRNAQGLDFHPLTKLPFVSEHGPSTNDEVNRVLAGKNYGWPTHQGAPGAAGFEDSIYAWTPTVAPAGSVFYTRSEIPGWFGSFLMLTLKEQDMRRLTPGDSEFTTVASEDTLLNAQLGRLRAIRVGPDGWLYIGNSERDGRGTPEADDDQIVRVRYQKP